MLKLFCKRTSFGKEENHRKLEGKKRIIIIIRDPWYLYTVKPKNIRDPLLPDWFIYELKQYVFNSSLVVLLSTK